MSVELPTELQAKIDAIVAEVPVGASAVLVSQPTRTVEAMNPVVLLTGVPGAGKSTVAAKLRSLRRDFRVVDGDAIVRDAGRGLPFTPEAAQLIKDRAFPRLLDRVQAMRERGPVVVDSALPGSMLRQASQALRPGCTIVGLRISEEERARRQADRNRRGQLLSEGADEATLTPLAEQALSVCDIVLDANGPARGGQSVKACAYAILDHLDGLGSD